MLEAQAPDIREINLRPGRPEDALEIGRICYEAFNSISGKHGYPCDFPNVDVAVNALRGLLSHPKFYSVVAERDEKIIGSNFLDERASVTGVGPITVDPAFQNRNTGKELMLAVMRRSREIGAAGIRLVQAAYHTRSLALYAKLGFEPMEPLSNFQGSPVRTRILGRDVRKANESDLKDCSALCLSVHGHDRSNELLDSIKGGSAHIVEHAGRVTGYSSGLAWFGHSVGETNEDIIALISSVDSYGGPGILVPTRNSRLLRWCLQNGLRINQQMTLMTIGLYNEPRGSYLPSVLF